MPKIQKVKEMWFNYPDDPMGGKVLIRHLKEGEVQDLLDDHSETKAIYNTESNTHETVMIRKNVMPALAAASVVDWENFFDGKPAKGNKHGKPLPCTKKNVFLFCKEDGFLAFISESREKLSDVMSEREKESEKNSNG